MTALDPPEHPLEPVVGARSGVAGLGGPFRALRHRDYALFWSAALVSQTGSWMQNLTVPFVVHRATGSTAWIGFASFCQYFPAFVLSPIGGMLADRVPRKTVTLLSNVIGMTGAAALALAWRDGQAGPWTTAGLVSLVGMATGLGLPAWQSLMPSLVPPDLLQNAVTLNSAQFNAARAFGPALGGVVLARWGPSSAFTINAVSYVAVIGAVLATRVGPATNRAQRREGPVAQLRSGFAYARRHRAVMVAVALVFAVAALGSPVIPFVTVFASDEFGVSRAAYGWLYACLGIGAVAAALTLATVGESIARSRQATFAGIAYCAALVVFGCAPWYWLGVVAMLAVGFGYLSTVNALNTAIQLLVDDDYRGRCLALYAMAITGGFPLGSWAQGQVAQVVGVRATVVGAASLLLVVLVAVARDQGVRTLDDHANAPSGAGAERHVRVAPVTSQSSPR
jgi:predicted MFS family arabinose efflux permease